MATAGLRHGQSQAGPYDGLRHLHHHVCGVVDRCVARFISVNLILLYAPEFNRLADRLSLALPFDFTQEDMNTLRCILLHKAISCKF